MEVPEYWAGWDSRAWLAILALYGAVTWHAVLSVFLRALVEWCRD